MQTTGRNPERRINERADRVAHIDGQLMYCCEQYTRASSGNAHNKTEQSIYECLLGFVLTTFSAPPQILAASTVFFCPIPETKK